MIWNHHLLRRFSSTSHFRLMNQLRIELRSQPLIRDSKTKSLNLQSKPSPVAYVRDNKREAYASTLKANETTTFDYQESSKESFRDRLNSIDMR